MSAGYLQTVIHVWMTSNDAIELFEKLRAKEVSATVGDDMDVMTWDVTNLVQVVFAVDQERARNKGLLGQAYKAMPTQLKACTGHAATQMMLRAGRGVLTTDEQRVLLEWLCQAVYNLAYLELDDDDREGYDELLRCLQPNWQKRDQYGK